MEDQLGLDLRSRGEHVGFRKLDCEERGRDPAGGGDWTRM